MKKTIQFKRPHSDVSATSIAKYTRTYLLATGYINADQDLDIIKSGKGVTVLAHQGTNDETSRALEVAVAYVCGVLDVLGPGVDYSII